MTLKNQFRALMGAYFGIRELDEYDAKVYILKDIKDFIDRFLVDNDCSSFDIDKEKNDVENNVSFKTKLQDALLFINKNDGPRDLAFLIENKIKILNKEEYK